MTHSAPIPAAALPACDADLLDWLCLIRSRRVGPTTFRRLIRQFGTARAALAALPDIAADAGETRYQSRPRHAAEAELAAGRALGARLLCLGDAHYPSALAGLGDAPPVLWALGDVSLLTRPLVAMVGARNASAIGLRMATKLARELGELGYVVTSGLARGIDGAAHQAALATGTIAVQAGGIDVAYPKENAELMLQIGAQGLRLSEGPPGLQPQARHFPQRNRIISGLSEAVVVVEGAAKSGSLITARNALDQGRDVMAVPGNPLDARAAGCNMLIRDGAVLVRSGADVAEALARPMINDSPELPLDPPPPAAPTHGRSIGPSDGLPSHILGLLSPTPIAEDILIREVGAPAPHVMAIIAELAMSGQVQRQPGGLVSLAQ